MRTSARRDASGIGGSSGTARGSKGRGKGGKGKGAAEGGAAAPHRGGPDGLTAPASVSVRVLIRVPPPPPPSPASPSPSGHRILVRVFAPDGTLAAEGVTPPSSPLPEDAPERTGAFGTGGIAARFAVASVALGLPSAPLWSAEDPALHTVVLALLPPPPPPPVAAVAKGNRPALPASASASALEAGDSDSGGALDWEGFRLGVREVSIAGGKLRVNGEAIMVAGVNRHEFDPWRGRALGEAGMVQANGGRGWEACRGCLRALERECPPSPPRSGAMRLAPPAFATPLLPRPPMPALSPPRPRPLAPRTSPS